MTTEFVRALTNKLSPLQQDFLEAVNDFAYETTWPIESKPGEYAGSKYNRGELYKAVAYSIVKLTSDNGGRISTHRLSLVKAIFDAEFNRDVLNVVENIVSDEAKKIIDNTSIVEDGIEKSLIRNGHHGRQYIAANTVEQICRRYFN